MDADQIHSVMAMQKEIFQAVQISNLLALVGRVMDLGILFIMYRCWLLLRSLGAR